MSKYARYTVALIVIPGALLGISVLAFVNHISANAFIGAALCILVAAVALDVWIRHG